MAAARHIGVGELVDEREVRSAGDQGVEVHLLEPLASVLNGPARNDFEAVQQGLGLFAAVGLHHANDDVRAILCSGPRLLQHLIGLADARSGAEEDLQPSGTCLFTSLPGKQCLGRGALI